MNDLYTRMLQSMDRNNDLLQQLVHASRVTSRTQVNKARRNVCLFYQNTSENTNTGMVPNPVELRQLTTNSMIIQNIDIHVNRSSGGYYQVVVDDTDVIFEADNQDGHLWGYNLNYLLKGSAHKITITQLFKANTPFFMVAYITGEEIGDYGAIE